MTVVVLRPNGTDNNDWTLNGGASAHAILSDDSDASYISAVGTKTVEVTLGDLTLPGGALITRRAIRARTACGSSTALTASIGNVNDSPSTIHVDSATYNVSWSVVTTTTPVVADGSFTDAEIDAALIGFYSASAPPVGLKIYETYADITYVILPVVTVSQPTGAITTTNLPVVTWSNVLDSDGGAQTSYQIKYFTAAQYGIGGFDPAVSPHTQDSEALTGASLTWTPTTPLADGTYRAYVRTGQTVNGATHWSAWAFSAFTLAVALPAVPTFTATADSPNARIALALDDNAGAATADVFEVQRSLDAGTTWETVRQLVSGYLSAANVLSVDAEGMETGVSWSNAVNTTPTQSATFALDGTKSLRMASIASGDMGVRITAAVVVSGGLVHTARGSFRAGANARSCRLDIAWYNAGGSNIGVSTGGTTADAVGSWTPVSMSATSPATAVSADVFLYVLGTGGAAELHYVDRISLKSRVTLYDYEAPNGVATQYRARALHNYSGLYAASAWTSTQTATWSSTSWRLSHPNIPALAMDVRVRSFQTVSRAGRSGTFQPLGASSAVVVADTRGPITGAITFRLDTLAEQAALDVLLDTTATLLLQSPVGAGGPGYVRFGSHGRQRVVDWADASRTFDTLDFTAVDRSVGDVVSWPVPPPSDFSPADIATLAHWFKADAITAADGDPVTTWPDSSANGRNATQATAGLKPTYKAAILNGLPVVRFDGGDVLLTPSWTSGPILTHIIVAKLDANGSYPLMTGRQDYLFEIRFHAATRAPSMSGSSVAASLAAVTLGDWHVYTGIWDSTGDALSIRQDGGAPTSDTDAVAPSTLAGVSSLGARWDATNFFTGDIAEVLTFDAGLSAPDITAVQQYLGTKYGIAVA